MDKLRLVVPVYNDWPSFRILILSLGKLAESLLPRISVSESVSLALTRTSLQEYAP
jgi:hypothetical protein